MRRAAPAALLVSLLGGTSSADTITLTNGRVIEADRAWYQGAQLYYEKNGATFGLPKSLVQKLVPTASAQPAADPEVEKARQRLAAGDPVGATRLLRAGVARDPRSLSAWQALAEASLALGDARAAREAALQAVRLDPRNARSQSLLGDASTAMGDRPGAEAAYRKSLELTPDADVRRKLGDVAPAPAQPSRGVQFRLQYDGGVNQPLGSAVIKALSEAHAEFARRLGSSPPDPITVVLETGTRLSEAGVPEWADGVNDGEIRVPVQGLDALTPRLVRVLRHELAHSFIAARTGGNCPTWLQEGVSQWLEGADPAREDARLAEAAREGRLLPLVTLEGPFDSLSEPDAELAYAQSLSAVGFILGRSRETGLVRLLSALGDRLPSEEALPVALALSYPELQKAWADSLSARSGR
ncbi:MAG TPA: tetratricopeptide repeat protein [Vicinamibacteria bacterium]|nr:tetratricopeptide repeat protein [Vicinamibacteria bacterium]